jgi:hypothetical protein
VINFRYHVVSLTAIFLALAIGLVVGTAASNGPLADSLSDQVDNIHKQNGQLRDTVEELNKEVNAQEKAWTSAAAMLLPGRLAGRRVLVVSMRSSAKYVDHVGQLLTSAGAKVTNRMVIEDPFTDPTSNDKLLDLALKAAPSGVQGVLPNHSNGVETSTALLAAVLVATAEVEGARTAVTAYQSQGFVEASGDFTAAEAVVFIAGSPYTQDSAAKRNAAVLTMMQRFDNAGKLVVATPSAAGDGNVVRAVRDDPNLVKTASTVDNVATELGQLVTALALAEQFDGRTGHYGNGSGATGAMPQPVGTHDGS